MPTEVTEMPGTSLVIPTWRRPAWLERCLQATISQELQPAEIIVVGRAEDGEAQRVTEAAASAARCPVGWVTVERPGHVAPVRRGIEAAEGDIVVFLDDDAEPEPGWLAALVGPFEDPTVACVGGRIREPGYARQPRGDEGTLRWYGQHVGNLPARNDQGPVEVVGVMEGNWAWRRGVLAHLEFDHVVDFDAAPMYGLDLCLQAKALGYRIMYQPAARALHYAAPRDPELDRADRLRRTMAYSRNYTYLGLKHLQGWRRLVFVTWWWLIGERGSYGLVAALVDLIGRRGGVGSLIRASFTGKRAGVQAWLAARR